MCDPGVHSFWVVALLWVLFFLSCGMISFVGVFLCTARVMLDWAFLGFLRSLIWNKNSWVKDYADLEIRLVL